MSRKSLKLQILVDKSRLPAQSDHSKHWRLKAKAGAILICQTPGEGIFTSMRYLTLLLPVWLASACAAQQSKYEDIALPVVELELEEVKKVERTEPEEEIPPKPPALPALTKRQFEDAFWRVASCYDFHIPPGASQGFSDEVRLVVYNPCLLTGFESAIDAQSEVNVKVSVTKLSVSEPGIYAVRPGLTLELQPEPDWPRLCVEPTLVGGTFPPEMRCGVLPHELGTNKYSFVSLSLWYLLIREVEDDQGKDP